MDPADLPFSCTDQIRPPEIFIGQDRAVEAIEFGLGIDAPGYNIFVSGLSGTGKSTVIRSHLEAAIERRASGNGDQEFSDWAYVHNFDRPDQPSAVQLPQGNGSELSETAERLLNVIVSDLPAALSDDSYTERVRQINERTANHRRDVISDVEREASARGFTVQAGSAGIAVVPRVDGTPMTQDQYLALSDEQREQVEAVRSEITRQVEEAMDTIKEVDREVFEELAELQRTATESVIGPAFDEAVAQFRNLEAEDACAFLDGLRSYSHANAPFIISGKFGEDGAAPGSPQLADPRLPFRVNVFVANTDRTAPPIIMQDNPTYSHLFGYIDRRPAMGAYVTDHTMLRAGSLVQANGGYLVIDARLALSHAAVWPALKRVLKGGEVRPEDPEDLVPGFLIPQPLRPEPIPIQVKVVFTGEPDIYQMLAMLDPDFWEVVKVRADLSHELDLNGEILNAYSQFVCGVCNEQNLKHFSAAGVVGIIEHSMRIVDHQDRLSARFGLLVDLVRESAHMAEIDGSEHTEREHVMKAVKARRTRSGQLSDLMQRLMLEGTIKVDLEGSRIGQVNGLAVYNSGDASFGKPSRITTQVFMGTKGLINIEREVELSGKSHDKGVLIMAGFLGQRFAQRFPLSVNVSIAFEQSYGPVDGDSASSTELYSILSALSGIPIRQDIAVTGSVNQKGEIQSIGGVNEKIEGFYDLCKEADKLGTAGVLIPKSNEQNLMLRPDVVDAIRNGEFHLYSASTVDEGIEILTGASAGAADDEDSYPADSVNGLAAARLRQFAERLRDFAGDGSK